MNKLMNKMMNYETHYIRYLLYQINAVIGNDLNATHVLSDRIFFIYLTLEFFTC